MQISSFTILEGLVGNFIHALLKIMGEFGPVPRQCDIMHNICFILNIHMLYSLFNFLIPYLYPVSISLKYKKDETKHYPTNSDLLSLPMKTND